jgi:hypothetical protein
MHEINGEVAIKLLCLRNHRSQMDNIKMRSVGYLLLVSAVSLLQIEASLTQELSAEDRACIVSAVAKLPNVPALKIERSRALPQSQSQGRRNLSLYNVMIEIDVSIVGENATYIFNCIRDGQMTVIESLGRSPGSLAQELSVEDRTCITGAVAKLPNVPALKIDRSRVLPQSQAPGRRNPSLYNVMVEIDVSVVGQSSTYIFNCIRKGQLTVIQPMGMR